VGKNKMAENAIGGILEGLEIFTWGESRKIFTWGSTPKIFA
jgi:hypothetical protein